MTEKVYVIQKNGKYLDRLFTDNIGEMFNATGLGKYQNVFDIGEIYFYYSSRIACDVAEQLNATWEKAIKNGNKVELV